MTWKNMWTFKSNRKEHFKVPDNFDYFIERDHQDTVVLSMLNIDLAIAK